MAKPKVFIINNGTIGPVKTDSKLGKGASSNTSTVSLIQYNLGKLMLVDTGMSCDWPKIKKGIDQHGGIKKVTHVLMTHWDQDHGQNLKDFKGAMAVSGIGTARIGTPDFGAIEDLYPDGFIEDPNIQYQNVSRTHSRDEMVYIVDSANNGKVIFIGDLIFAPLSELPIENVVGFDTMCTINPKRKVAILKELYTKYPDIKMVVCGHSAKTLDRKELGEYIKALEGPVYQKFLKTVIQ